MNSTRTNTLAVLAVLVLAMSGSFPFSVTAQQFDKPDLIQSFPGGNGPEALAFDGARIWVTNAKGATSPSCARATAARPKVLPGITPLGMLFDGTSVWVAYYGSGTLDKITRTLQ